MANAIVTPGYVFSNNEDVTYPKLNQLGQPTVSLNISSQLTSQDYLRNGNFYANYWLTPTGVSAPIATETLNASFWTVNPSGAAVTYSQDTTVPNTHSNYSAKITGATSVTAVNISQTIPSDLSATLNQKVVFSSYIFNNTGSTMTPVLLISSANVKDTFSAVTGIASISLQSISNGTWGLCTGTIDLTGLSNVNNGLMVSIQFPSGSLNSAGKSVNISQVLLQIGTVSTVYTDDFGLYPPLLTPSYVNSSLGYTPLFTPQNNVVINGNADVWQEKTSYTGLTGGSTKVADCFLYSAIGSNVATVAQNTTAAIAPLNVYNPYIQNSLKVTITTAQASLGVNDFLAAYTHIEGYLIQPLRNRNLSLQFWVRSSTPGTYSVLLRDSGPTAYIMYQYTIAAANTWQLITIQNIPQINTGIGTWNFNNLLGLELLWSLGAGTNNQTSTIGAWTAGSPLGSSAQTNLAGTNGNTWEVSGIQLEPGLYTTPLNYIPFPAQIPLCQRYYYKSYDYGTAPGAASPVGCWYSQSSTTALAFNNMKFPVTQRATTPTTFGNIYSATLGASGKVLVQGGGDVAINSIAAPSTTGFEFLGSAGLFTAGGQILFHIVSDVRL